MVTSSWIAAWMRVSPEDAAQAMATRTLAWARRRGSLTLRLVPPVEAGGWLCVHLRPGGLDALRRMAVPEVYDPDAFESKAAHRLAVRFAPAVAGDERITIRRAALACLERAVMRIEAAGRSHT